MKRLLTLSLLLCSACSTVPSKNQLIGLNRQQILQCMGQDKSRIEQGGREKLTFEGVETGALCPLKRLAGQQPTKHYCKVLFSLEDDSVVSVVYQSPDGGVIDDDSLCSFLVEKCIK